MVTCELFLMTVAPLPLLLTWVVRFATAVSRELISPALVPTVNGAIMKYNNILYLYLHIMEFTFDDIPTIDGAWADEVEEDDPPRPIYTQQEGAWIREKQIKSRAADRDDDRWTTVPIRKAYRRPVSSKKKNVCLQESKKQ